MVEVLSRRNAPGAAWRSWWRIILSGSLVWLAGSDSHDAFAQETTHGSATNSAPVTGAYQVVVRVSQRAFQSPEPEVHEKNPIDMMVLGTRAVGQGETTAQVFPDFRRSGSGAAFDLVFRGSVRAHTVGRRDPAVIHTQTWCDFELRAPIRLHRDTGFVSGEVHSRVDITHQCRTISSTVPGLRGRLVRRIAARRVESQEALLQQITRDETRQRLETAFRDKVDQRLARWNRWFTTVQTSLRQQPWFEQLPELALGSDEDHLLIGVNFVGRDRHSRPLLPELPTAGADDQAYPLDIFIGPELFESVLEQVTAAGFVAMVSQVLSRPREPPAGQILERLEQLSVEVGQAGPWTVIQVRRDPSTP